MWGVLRVISLVRVMDLVEIVCPTRHDFRSEGALSVYMADLSVFNTTV